MKYVYAVLVFLLALAGCGGGGDSHLLDITGSASLTPGDGVNQDDSLYDSRSFTATRDGWIQVTMASSNLDPYIVVYRGVTEDVEVGSDDNGGTNHNAVLFFQAHEGQTYTAKFTTAQANDLGDYLFTIKEVTHAQTLSRAASAPLDSSMKRSK